MAAPTLSPVQKSPTFILPETGSMGVASNVDVYTVGIYVDTASDLYDANFISGAADQVRYVYRSLGGDVLDIELTEKNVCHAYETAVLEYSYLVNLWQSKNALGSALGAATASFDHDGQITSANSGSNYALKYPKWDFKFARRVSRRYSTEAGVGGDVTFFSASIPLTPGKQSYDLQLYISASAMSGNVEFADLLGTNRIEVKRVYYKSPHQMWRFFGYYGGLNAVGNLSNYGMYADDSTFEVIPPWQNKLQAMAYEDAIWTRNSHHQYDLKNNRLRLYPAPTVASPDNLWIEFIIPSDVWSEDANATDAAVTGAGSAGSVDGVNNINTIPFSNLPFNSINGQGKHWIRRYALAECKGMLAQIRGKLVSGIPIPNETVQLNHAELMDQSISEKEALREELKQVLEDTLYRNLAKYESEMTDNTDNVIQKVPIGIFVG
jgi:hypothetical protein